MNVGCFPASSSLIIRLRTFRTDMTPSVQGKVLAWRTAVHVLTIFLSSNRIAVRRLSSSASQLSIPPKMRNQSVKAVRTNPLDANPHQDHRLAHVFLTGTPNPPISRLSMQIHGGHSHAAPTPSSRYVSARLCRKRLRQRIHRQYAAHCQSSCRATRADGVPCHPTRRPLRCLSPLLSGRVRIPPFCAAARRRLPSRLRIGTGRCTALEAISRAN